MLRAPKVEPPSEDMRWRIVQGTMRRNGFSRHALIETLHTVQESFGFLTMNRCIMWPTLCTCR